MQTFIATLNQSGAEKIGRDRARVALMGSTIRFYEDDMKTAHVFYRRYIRNMTTVRLHATDYSIYAPNYGEDTARPLGLHEPETV